MDGQNLMSRVRPLFSRQRTTSRTSREVSSGPKGDINCRVNSIDVSQI